MRNKPVPVVSAEDAAYVRSFLLHEDAEVLVFDKPSGLPSQGGPGILRSLDSLLDAFAKSNGKRPRLVHRLDTQTSGVMIAAKTKPAAAAFSKSFSDRLARKTYLAIVAGEMSETASAVIDASLVKVREGGRARMLVAKDDREGAVDAVTHLKVLAHGGGASLVELSPQTGRMHQLRIHMAHTGHHILGDPLYGRGQNEATRLMLHASSLSLPNISGKMVSFTAELPEAFVDALASRGLQSGLK